MRRGVRSSGVKIRERFIDSVFTLSQLDAQCTVPFCGLHVIGVGLSGNLCFLLDLFGPENDTLNTDTPAR